MNTVGKVESVLLARIAEIADRYPSSYTSITLLLTKSGVSAIAYHGGRSEVLMSHATFDAALSAAEEKFSQWTASATAAEREYESWSRAA